MVWRDHKQTRLVAACPPKYECSGAGFEEQSAEAGGSALAGADREPRYRNAVLCVARNAYDRSGLAAVRGGGGFDDSNFPGPQNGARGAEYDLRVFGSGGDHTGSSLVADPAAGALARAQRDTDRAVARGGGTVGSQHSGVRVVVLASGWRRPERAR